jgi:fluoride exporter
VSRALLPVIALGGALGALARYGLAAAWPSPPGHFPWATFVTNVSGCLLIGAVMALVVHVGAARPLMRPFLGTGVLGGYTTFSAYAVDGMLLVDEGALLLAVLYVVGTVIAALLAVTVAGTGTRFWLRHAGVDSSSGPG